MQKIYSYINKHCELLTSHDKLSILYNASKESTNCYNHMTSYQFKLTSLHVHNIIKELTITISAVSKCISIHTRALKMTIMITAYVITRGRCTLIMIYSIIVQLFSNDLCIVTCWLLIHHYYSCSITIVKEFILFKQIVVMLKIVYCYFS